MPGGPVKGKPGAADEAAILSDRELDIWRRWAGGESWNEIGQNLFLSLNTVQFHVKSVYRKLLVNQYPADEQYVCSVVMEGNEKRVTRSS